MSENTKFSIIFDKGTLKIADSDGQEVSQNVAVHLIKSLIGTYGLDTSERVPACVYILEKSKKDHYKIGVTSQSLETRVKAIRYSEKNVHIYPIHTINCDTTPQAYALEKELHRYFDSQRVYGEWFELDQTDLSWIKRFHAAQDWFTKPIFSNNDLIHEWELISYEFHRALIWIMDRTREYKKGRLSEHEIKELKEYFSQFEFANAHWRVYIKSFLD
jgi:hypothetical protein